MITADQATSVKKHLAGLTPTLAGKFFRRFWAYRKEIAQANIERVFADALTPAEKEKLLVCFYSHAARSFWENIIIRFMTTPQLIRRATVEADDEVLEIARSRTGALVMTGHFGNWEFAPIAGSLGFKEFEGNFYFVRKTIGKEWVQKILFRRYHQAGIRIIPKKNALPRVMEALDKSNAVFFVMDQHASTAGREGIKVDFFGHPAGTFRSLALVARYSEKPVIPAHVHRTPEGKHILRFYTPLKWQTAETPEEEVALNTRLYNKTLEDMILTHPEQWLWVHRRWKDV